MYPAVPADFPRLAQRMAETHKGDFGHALLIGGSQGMAGAVALAGMAAARSGAGLVTLATARDCQPTVAGFEPSLMCVPLECDEAGRISSRARTTIEVLATGATAVGLGPGLGRSDELKELVAHLYQSIGWPMVIDADGLNALSPIGRTPLKPGGARILTPHPGEFARLIGRERIDAADRERLAAEVAQQTGVVVVLKGHRTVISDGVNTCTNLTGNPGMATGGTGDVLTGMIAAMLCQHLTPYDAARLAVYVHGMAGDMAADELGEISMIASDMIRFLPAAWSAVT